MPATKPRINLDDPQDRRQYRCPNGHVRWEPTNYHYWCSACARAWEVDGDFDELVNEKSGKTLQRDEVDLFREVAGKIEPYSHGGG